MLVKGGGRGLSLDHSHCQQMLPNSRNMPKHGKNSERGCLGPLARWAGISGRSQLVSTGPLPNQGKMAEMWERDWTLPRVPENNTVKLSNCCTLLEDLAKLRVIVMLGGVWRSVCPASHFTEGETEAWVWGGRWRLDWRWMAKPGQNAGVRMPKTRPFHDAPVPLGLGSVGRPTACHHFSPTDQLVGGGQEDDGETPQDRLGHSHFSHGQVLGPQVLKMHLKKRTNVLIAWQKLWCRRPSSLSLSSPFPSMEAAPTS